MIFDVSHPSLERPGQHTYGCGSIASEVLPCLFHGMIHPGRKKTRKWASVGAQKLLYLAFRDPCFVIFLIFSLGDVMKKLSKMLTFLVFKD